MLTSPLLPTAALLLATAGLAAADPILFGAGAPPPTWSLGIVGWKDVGKVTDGVIVIAAADARGGMIVGADLDIATVAELTPRLRVRLGAGNQATRFSMNLSDGDKTRHKFAFDLSAVQPGVWTEVLPVHAPAVGKPVETGEPGEIPGLGHIVEVAFLGDWSGNATQLEIDRIDAIAADAAILASREKGAKAAADAAEKKRKQDEAARLAREKKLAEGAAHPKDGPEILAVHAVAADVLAVVIQDRTPLLHPQEAYVAQEGDQLVAGKGAKPIPHYRDDKAVDEPPLITLMRPAKPGATPVNAGSLAGDGSRRTVQRGEESAGVALDRSLLTEPAAWKVRKGEAVVQITAVAVKLKPDSIAGKSALCRVYLTLAEPLTPDAAYNVVPHGINTRQAEMPYVHATKAVRSEAVHASQVGYRPDDPAKHAFLSLWKGTGGAQAYPDGLPFEVLDATGAVAFSGRAVLVRKESEGERLKGGHNMTQAPVHLLDFTAVTKPGTYRVHVPGIGCSYPFPIAADAWLQAMRVSMRGLLAHRNGIELAPPLLPYRRPRPMHPADGFRPIPTPAMGKGVASSVCQAIRTMMAAGPLPKPMDSAWGGYMDAGDWDRHTGHLAATALLLELYDTAPAFWRQQKLDLPADEVANRIPDLLDEALWNIDFYIRLQDEDGGVHGGIESTEHPMGTEASWQERLVLGVFAKDHQSSYLLAATAAPAGRQLAAIVPERSAQLLVAAKKAWTWAEAHGDESSARMQAEKINCGPWRQSGERAWAAAALLQALPKDPLAAAWQAAYAEAAASERQGADTLAGEQHLWTYANLPDGVGDAALKTRARATILAHADRTLALMRGNSFALGLPVEGLPTIGFVAYCTAPGMIARSLPRAWLLSGEAKYLEGTVASCGFAVGANPDNIVYTTGLGANPVRWALHCDSRALGLPAPPGITVYGPTDAKENAGMMEWVFTWFIGSQSIPNGKAWPMYESYFDIYVVPQMNEYTITQTIVPSAYTWGILASRPAGK